MLTRFFHVFSRGVDKRVTFEDDGDRGKFLDQMMRFRFSKADASIELVRIRAYCLMSNHFHFLVEQVEEHGLAVFMQRLMTGYTMFFNKSRDRTGALFESTYRRRHVEDDAYLHHVLSYVHANPMKLIFPMRELRKPLRAQNILERLRQYPWSSLGEWLTNRFRYVSPVYSPILPTPEEHVRYLSHWLQDSRFNLGEV